MNFFETVFALETGTNPNSLNNTTALYNSYYGSSTTFTKTQLSAFDAELTASGLNKPPGIDSLLQNFDQTDSNHDGTLTAAEIQAYLTSNGFLPQTQASLYNAGFKGFLANLVNKMESSMQNNNNMKL